MNHEKTVPASRKDAISAVQQLLSSSVEPICMLFSGGKDSSAVLCAVAEALPGRKIDLLLLNNGHFYPEEMHEKILTAVRRIESTGVLEGHELAIKFFDFRGIMIGLAMRSLHDDVKHYPTSYLCSACKLIMHYVSGEYCRLHAIRTVLDGYNRKQQYYPEQVPGFRLCVAEALEKRFGVRMLSPLYEVIRKKGDAESILAMYGLNPDDFDREKGGQAVCSLGGNFKPPRLTDGVLDMTFYEAFAQGSIQYARSKMEILDAPGEVVQIREAGPIRFPSFPEQIRAVAANARTIQVRR